MRLALLIMVALLCVPAPAHADMTTDAEKGDPAAQFELGNLYRWGDDKHDPDPLKAEKSYRAAAEQGLAAAQNGLGELYIDGVGIDKNYGEALKWFSKAAQQDNRQAQVNLVNLYVNGTGVPKDIPDACFWAAVSGAAETPVFDAESTLDIRKTLCLKELRPDQVEDVRKRVEDFKAAHSYK